MLVFALLQLQGGINWLRSHLSSSDFKSVLSATIFTAVSAFAVVAIAGSTTGYFSNFTGRFYSLLDPTYAKEHIPIIASVSEHQPTTWASFFFDLHVLVFLFPAGLYFCFRKLEDSNIFLIIYAVTSVYFSGVMVRLILVLAPIACVMGGIGFSETLTSYIKQFKASSNTKDDDNGSVVARREIAIIMILGLVTLSIFYSYHCTWVTSEAYSSPSIVLAARQPDGSKLIFDDFREAYYWLRHNTKDDARVMSWWDYGYQLAAMANRTILVDNNTWNNSHIAQVGKAFASNEENAYVIMRNLDVDYVLVIFGGLIGYSSDDINKFLWMVRIAGSTDSNIRERDYFTKNGEYSIGPEASQTMLNSLMYKVCYYRFGDILIERDRPRGFDRVRGTEIGRKDFSLEYLDEAYTTKNWLVRVYKVKDLTNRA